MRLYEILSESTKDKMKADLKGLLLSLKASRGYEIPTSKIVNQMNNMGYTMTMDSVVPFITELPMVASADTTTIKLGSKDDLEMGDEEGMDDADQMTMDNLASKGADAVGQGLQK
jgi:hypothetical protein